MVCEAFSICALTNTGYIIYCLGACVLSDSHLMVPKAAAARGSFTFYEREEYGRLPKLVQLMTRPSVSTDNKNRLTYYSTKVGNNHTRA